MDLKRIMATAISAIISCIILSSCGLVEMGGTMMKKTGEVMEDYGEKNDGIIGNMTGFGGRIHTTVGSTVEDIARDGKTGSPGETSTKQFKEANKAILSSTFDAASAPPSNGAKTVMRVQKRLKTLGYDPGPADGIMGSRTKRAIVEYQQSHGLPLTGTVEEGILKSLEIE